MAEINHVLSNFCVYPSQHYVYFIIILSDFIFKIEHYNTDHNQKVRDLSHNRKFNQTKMLEESK